MPDAIYLYKTGYWSNFNTRTERIGSVALDYVGKCFNDGEFEKCCLLVKFACHNGKFDDHKKWYVYPDITDDQAIWDILTYRLGDGVSIGRGYHHQVHPLLTTTQYEQVSPPMLRIYTNHSSWFNGMYMSSENAFSTYIRIRSFNDITQDETDYIHTNKSAQFEYIMMEGRLYRGINKYARLSIHIRLLQTVYHKITHIFKTPFFQ